MFQTEKRMDPQTRKCKMMVNAAVGLGATKVALEVERREEVERQLALEVEQREEAEMQLEEAQTELDRRTSIRSDPVHQIKVMYINTYLPNTHPVLSRLRE